MASTPIVVVCWPILVLAFITCVVDIAARPRTDQQLGPGSIASVHEEVLADGYVVQWEPDYERETITFSVLVQTTNYVGFGISNGGGMAGADIVIGGVNSGDGESKYFEVRAISALECLCFANVS